MDDSGAATCQVQARPGICEATTVANHTVASSGSVRVECGSLPVNILTLKAIISHNQCNSLVQLAACNIRHTKVMWPSAEWSECEQCYLPVKLRLFSWYSSLVGRSGAGRPCAAAAAIAAARSAPPRLPAGVYRECRVCGLFCRTPKH